ncbi:hypothetical protein EV122DRAFT_283570 [Schizophyllum commune]
MPTSDSMWAPHNADKRDTWFGAERAQSTTTTYRERSATPRDTTRDTKPLSNQEDAPTTPSSSQPPMTSGAYQSMWAPHNADKRAEWLYQRHPSVVEEPTPTTIRKESMSVFVASEARLLQTALYEALDTSPPGERIDAQETKTLCYGSALDGSEDAPNLAKGLAIQGASAGVKAVEDSEESGEPRTPRRAKKIKRHTASESAPWGRWDHDQFESM